MRKIALTLLGVVAVAGGVAAVSAYEAHVINVTAHIENALTVDAKELVFGTVFPQEYVTKDFNVTLSSSFLTAERVDDVDYVIKQKPKCICDDPTGGEGCQFGKYAPVDYASHECPAGYTAMLSLCPYLSKTDGDPGDANDTSHVSYYIDPTPEKPNSGDEHCPQPTKIVRIQPGFGDGGWAGWSCPAGTTAVGGGIDSSTNPVGGNGVAAPGAPAVDGFSYPVYPHYTFGVGETGYVVHDLVDGQGNNITFHVDCLPNNPDATGRLTKVGQDTSDKWIVDLKVPPVKGFVGQDWPAGCPVVEENDQDYGCDLWIEVTGISPAPTPTPSPIPTT